MHFSFSTTAIVKDVAPNDNTKLMKKYMYWKPRFYKTISFFFKYTELPEESMFKQLFSCLQLAN